jgi:transcriptional regulator with XRE-family HTH domain
MRTNENGNSAAPPAFPQPGRFHDDLMLALKARRERAKLSSAELGRLAGLGVSYIGMMERGRINAQISTVLKLVQIIDTKQTLDPRAVSTLQDLFQVVDDLRGWIKNTRESLKLGWLSPAEPARVIARMRGTGSRAQADGIALDDSEGRSLVNQEAELTFASLLARAEEKLGSKKAVREWLNISGQRLSDAARGGMPIRSERVVRLALVVGVEPTDALRASGH